MKFNHLRIGKHREQFSYINEDGNLCVANFDLFLIRQARRDGCSFEDLADGFGPGRGTMGGDWSGIRDSSNEALDKMFERALNHFFGGEEQ